MGAVQIRGCQARIASLVDSLYIFAIFSKVSREGEASERVRTVDGQGSQDLREANRL